MEIGLISVDRWTGGSQVYFLTHLHSDHTQGLSSSWAKGPLFSSRLTAKLLPFKFPNFNLALIRIVDTGSWHSMSLVSPSTGSQTVLEVLAIDAHHCPGAVMFMFRGDFGCLLYTGDFRWEATDERANKGRETLLKALKDNPVDILYLDNTYCNPSYAFPSREIAAQLIVDIIVSHPQHDIVIGIDTLGKEDLLQLISRALNIKIWVWPERLQTMHLLGFHDTFTTKTSFTRVRAVPRYSFSVETLIDLNSMRPTIGIMPSGLPWVVKHGQRDDNPFISPVTSPYQKNSSSWSYKPTGNIGCVERFHQYIYSVPYSDHACFAEIKEFVQLVRPTNIKGIVSYSSCYIDPLYYFGRLCEANQPAMCLHQLPEGKDRDVRIKLGRKRGRTFKAEYIGTQLSRVSALRRKRRGAKIIENN